MWTMSERICICQYAENCSIMVRVNSETERIELYIQNYDEKDWKFCFSVTEEEYAKKTGAELPAAYSLDGEALVKACRKELKEYEHPMEKEIFIPFVRLSQFYSGEDGQYSLKNGQLVKVDASIERIETLYYDNGEEGAKILLEDGRYDAVTVIDSEICEDFMADFKEGDKTRVTGRVYYPSEPEEGQSLSFDAYRFEFR